MSATTTEDLLVAVYREHQAVAETTAAAAEASERLRAAQQAAVLAGLIPGPDALTWCQRWAQQCGRLDDAGVWRWEAPRPVLQAVVAAVRDHPDGHFPAWATQVGAGPVWDLGHYGPEGHPRWMRVHLAHRAGTGEVEMTREEAGLQ